MSATTTDDDTDDTPRRLALDLVAFHADIPTTARLRAVHRAVQVRKFSASAYHAMRRCVHRWKATAAANARKKTARRRVNSWRTGRRFDEDAPLLCYDERLAGTLSLKS